jgi:putative ABC transport system permease protein
MRTLWRRVIGVLNKAQRDRDFSTELDAHLQAHIDDNVRAGMTREDARRQALLSLGGVDMTKEAYRAQRGLPLLEQTTRELRHAFERLRRSPAFTAATVLSLGLAIGANASIFAVVERIVVNPLPYPASNRLVMLDFSMPSRNIPAGFNSMTAREYFFYADHARTIDSLAAYRWEDRTLTGETAERIRIARTTPSLTTVLRTPPEIGSWLPDGQRRGAAPSAVLSHRLWTRRYGADPGIVGRAVVLDGVATTVTGVMPASFAFPDAAVELWVNEPFRDRFDDDYSYTGVARLRDGASLDGFRAEINQLARSVATEAPGQGYEAIFSTALTLQDFTVGQIAKALWFLLAAAGVVLLIACANIANLFLVRCDARQREIAVRRALGAGTAGIAGYFLAESALLSIAGGALGLAAAWAGIRLLVASGPALLPRLNEIQLAPIHVVFVLGLVTLATFAFGLIPLARIRSSSTSLHDSSRSAVGANRNRTRHVLMGAQVAFALVLLVASGLLVRSFMKLRALDLGFDPSSRLTFQVGLPPAAYPDRERLVRGHQTILARVAALPGVRSASMVNCVPISGRGFCGGAPLFKEGEPPPRSDNVRQIIASRPVAASFFETMGMPFVLGRGITQADIDSNSLVTVINDTLMRAAFGGENPLGKRIRLAPHRTNDGPLWFTIVGVVHTTPTIALAEPRPVPQMYLPLFAGRGDIFPRNVDVMTYVLQTSTPPLGLAGAVRAAIKEIDPNLALAQVRTMQDVIDAAAAPRAFTMVLIAIAASAALLLGVVGIYGVMSYVVSQRTSEIGVRLALGAEPGMVMRMIVRQGGIVALGGIGVGLAAALAGGRAISSLLYQVSARDPQVFVVATITLLAIAVVACWVPARRAAHIDPLVALRTE